MAFRLGFTDGFVGKVDPDKIFDALLKFQLCYSRARVGENIVAFETRTKRYFYFIQSLHSTFQTVEGIVQFTIPLLS